MFEAYATINLGRKVLQPFRHAATIRSQRIPDRVAGTFPSFACSRGAGRSLSVEQDPFRGITAHAGGYHDIFPENNWSLAAAPNLFPEALMLLEFSETQRLLLNHSTVTIFAVNFI